MFQQILIHTPLYVWAILGFLVYRGVAASKDRVVGYRSLFIVPAIMLTLGLDSIARGFRLETLAGAAWMVGVMAATALAWRRSAPVKADRAAGTVLQPGSWTPLVLMMAIFCFRYATGVALAMLPALHADSRFAVPVCLAIGVFNGIFAGRLLRAVSSWRHASGSTLATALSAAS